MLLTSANMIRFFTSSTTWSGSISSQIYPRVLKEANLTYYSVCSALVHRVGNRSSHSFLGISILAIPATTFATWLLTYGYSLPSYVNTASFTYPRNWVSRLTQYPSYFESPDLFVMKFLKMMHAIWRDPTSRDSSAISRVSVAINFLGSWSLQFLISVSAWVRFVKSASYVESKAVRKFSKNSIILILVIFVKYILTKANFVFILI